MDDINDVVELGQTVMSFGKFISSKTLGSHLTLTNKTDVERIIQISVDCEPTYATSTSCLFRDYNDEDLPYKPSVGPTTNSEPIFKLIFIENPKTKSLEKQVTFRL